MLAYGFAPLLAATLLAFGVLWLAHARALKFAGTGLASIRSTPGSPASACSSWAIWSRPAPSIPGPSSATSARARIPAEANAWRDSVFGLPLKFYLFDLPFYSDLRGYLLALVIVCVLVYWVAARGWQLRYRLPELREMRQIDPSFFRLEGGLESRFLRGALVIFLLALALRFFLARYEMVYDDHGFMVGIDYVDQNFRPAPAVAGDRRCLAAAGLVWMRRWILAASMAISLVLSVRRAARWSRRCMSGPTKSRSSGPTSIPTFTPRAPLMAWSSTCEKSSSRCTPRRPSILPLHKSIIDNVRLWDWRAFHDTVTPDPGAAALLRLLRYRRRPLHHRRRVSPGAAHAARTGYQPVAATPARAGSIPTSSTRTATAWCWRRSADSPPTACPYC